MEKAQRRKCICVCLSSSTYCTLQLFKGWTAAWMLLANGSCVVWWITNRVCCECNSLSAITF